MREKKNLFKKKKLIVTRVHTYMVRRRRYSKEGKILFRLFIRRQLFQQTLAAMKYIFYWNIFLSGTKMLNWQLQGKKSSWRWIEFPAAMAAAGMNVQQQEWMFSSRDECSTLYKCSAAGKNVLHCTNVQQQEWMFCTVQMSSHAGMNVLYCTNVQHQ